MTWQGYKIKEDAGELQYSNCCETAPACRSNAPWQRLLQLFAVLPLQPETDHIVVLLTVRMSELPAVTIFFDDTMAVLGSMMNFSSPLPSMML